MKFDWGTFLVMWLTIIGLTLWSVGMVMTLASGNGMWLLLWIPAALVTSLMSCRY